MRKVIIIRNRLIIVLCILFCCVALPDIHSLTVHEIEMFKQLQTTWSSESKTLLDKRSAFSASDPQYTELTKRIVHAQYWESYYKEAQIDRSSWWNIITNTVIWSVQDLAEVASIMWETSEDLIAKVYTGNWTALLKDTADSLMRQKLRSMMRATFGGPSYPEIEEYIFSRMLAPKIETSAMEQYAEQAYQSVKDSLKDAYVKEVTREAKTLSKTQLEAYTNTIAERVGGAINVAEFSFDMMQKYVLWDEAQGSIEAMLSHILHIQQRESCDVERAFAIYLGKESLSVSVTPPIESHIEPSLAIREPKEESITPTSPPPIPTPLYPQFISASDTQKIDQLLWSITPSSYEDIIARHIHDSFTSSSFEGSEIYYGPRPEHSTRLPTVVTMRSSGGIIDSILVEYDESYSDTLLQQRTHYLFSRRISGTSTYERSKDNRTLEEIFGYTNTYYVKKQWNPEGTLLQFQIIERGRTILHYSWDVQGNVVRSIDNRPLVDGKKTSLPWE